ncbi:unnamed protein product [Chironomus riparius]|uniref:cystathionine gamma-lyase n=1 Tax=Chironomus riparius TaxID=315576 RepID=A0A9N9X147_9DIPT|nr:unnamed protein product [Chironomus riparius]
MNSNGEYEFDDQNESSLWEKLGFLKKSRSFATKSIHMDRKFEEFESSSTLSLINLTSTYKLFEAHNPTSYQYSRFGNPTRNNLEKCLASLENSKYAVTYASGLGAQTAIISTLKKGEKIVVDFDMNFDSIRLFKNFTGNMAMELEFVDFSDLDALKNALKENTKLVWMETPSSRTMKVLDIRKISDFVHENLPTARVVVDNTILSSYLQRPLEFGADVVVYSINKYVHGYSDVVMGSIAVNDDKVHEKLKYHQGAMGIIPSPFDCYMVNKSLKTLSLRMDHHMKVSYKIAKWLEKQPQIEVVLHPALQSHPKHDVACQQSHGHSGVFAFKLKNPENVENFLKNLKIFLKVESIGGFESFMRRAEKVEGIEVDGNLINVSIGLEDADDLIEDIQQALDGRSEGSNGDKLEFY